MENNLFRKKSLEHISSPEEMHDYMRVTSPRIWMLLGAILLLLIGFIIYIATATMESTETITVHSSFGMLNARVPLSRLDTLKIHMPVRINDRTGKITDITQSSAFHLEIKMDSGEPLADGEWTMLFEPDSSLPEPLQVPENEDEEIYEIFLDVSNSLCISYSFTDDLDYMKSRDWRVRVNGDLGTLTDIQVIDVGSLYITLDDSGEELPEGTYQAQIVTENTTPISFLLN